ncbi:MAG: MFS transporter [Chloroflexi bacterium]|nr:MFS transporter [Chloroflexota bacterium]
MNNISFSQRYTIPCLIGFLQSTFLWAILTYITIYWIDIGFSHFQVGLLISVFPLVSLILMIPFGVFVDRISPKKLVIASQLIFALSIVGLLTAHDFWSTMLMLGIGGTGNALFNNALSALFYKTLGDKIRGLKLGFFTAGILIGYGLGSLLGGYLLSAFDMNAIFLFSLAGTLPMVILSLQLPDIPGARVKISDYRADISNRSVLIFIILVFAFSLHAGAEQSSFSLFLNKEIKLDKESVGWIFFIHANVMALLSIISGFYADRVNSRGKGLAAPYYVGIAISGITNILLVFTNSFGTVLATRLTHAVGDSLTLVTRSLIVSNLFVSTRMGGNLATIQVTITLGTLFGSIISGAVPGYASGFFIAGAAAVIAVIYALIAKPEF